MADCEVCGREATTNAKIEGAILQVCNGCVRYGKEVNATTARFVKPVKLAPEVELVPSYGGLIAKARQAKGLSREDLAKQLNMKEKDLQHFEEQRVKPTQVEADRIAHSLGIILVVKSSESTAPTFATKKTTTGSSMPTLGDFIKIKNK